MVLHWQMLQSLPGHGASANKFSGRNLLIPTSDAIVLPATVRPVKYRIKLQPDLDRFTFQGDESIDINIVEATREIVLNALDLEIASATLHCGGSAKTARPARARSR